MKITFKNVGQGDTIIIEWLDGKGIAKIGIVDCKMQGDINPVVAYLESQNYEEIQFLILSHPHDDHFSGYLVLLEYLQEKNIPIQRMGHTIGFQGAEAYWKYFVVNTEQRNLLEKIVAKWAELKASKLIKRMDLLHDGKVLDIDDEMIITCLSPGHDDFERYQKKVDLDSVSNEVEASRAANILSTILKVSYKNHHVLLTSDAEKINFKGVLDRDSRHISKKRFHVCQMPHHGSFSNLAEEFWSVIGISDPQHAVASAGKGYRHPSIKVLQYFYNSGYKIHCTNIVNGMEEFVSMLDAKAKSFDNFSVLKDEYVTSNDRVFELNGEEVTLIE